MKERYRESGTYNDLIEYRRAFKTTSKAYKEAKRKCEKKLAKSVTEIPKSIMLISDLKLRQGILWVL